MSALKRTIEWGRRLEAPVLVQEMRVRQRGAKPFIVLAVYSLVLSVVACLILFFIFPSHNTRPITAEDMANAGQMIFGCVSLAQLGLVMLIVPAYSAAAISGERERRTFDLLALTVLSSPGIVTQKLTAALAQALMLIIASLPIVGVVFLLGGVSPFEVAVVYSLLVVTSILLGSLGMLCSCCARNSRTSTFLAYMVVSIFFIALPIGGEWLRSIAGGSVFQSESSFPIAFACILAFAGGVVAFMIYAPVSLILSRKLEIWRTKAFRMGVFGGVYAILLLLLSAPSRTDAVIDALYYSDMFLPSFVNPFVAMCMFFDKEFDSSGGSTAYWIVGTTIAFSLGCAFVFRQISSARFAGLRRS